jgi:ABC-2 type transport system ATP-binding protein
MQRRLELACALVHEPALLFFDEPTAGIDPVLRQKFWDEFRRLRELGRTLFITTQYVGESEHCDNVAVLQQGKLIALGPPDDLRKQALGGDVIEVEPRRLVDAATLSELGGIREVQQAGPRKLLVYAEDAGEATPRVLEAIASQGGEVVSSREYRPTFDEVFTRLVNEADEPNEHAGGDGRVPNGQVGSVESNGAEELRARSG